ncbi:SSI family serine proteinase inhibitor [Streptomyces sp. NPDC007264]|uniref:SSI family serine proteinase inhibitor n=1 Tax=Streptomyces sp. NPDC007264 TaxID=3364777 RepID=UPI0036DC887E
MKNTTLALSGALAAAAALLVAAPAQAVPRPAGTGNWLYLTVTRSDDRSMDVNGTLLLCDPPRGHVLAGQACAELAAAEGDIGRIPRRDAMCPMVYAPVTVSARGQWNGQAVDYSHTFSNACDLQARTGAVFALPDRTPVRTVPGLR